MSNKNPLHLYRALLRAATYLPDQIARKFVQGQASLRFRQHAQPNSLTQARISKAVTTTNQIYRACRGDLKCLKKVLKYAYCQTGVQKRISMQKLRALAPNVSVRDGKNYHQSELLIPKSPVKALMLSQNAVVKTKGSVIKKIAPVIPRTNIWGRPMPQKRQRNIVNRFTALNLSKMLPPPPERHWMLLQDLSLGMTSFPGRTPRRKRGTCYSSTNLQSDSCVEDQSDSLDDVREECRYNYLTPRLMRRLWSEVFLLAPRIGSLQESDCDVLPVEAEMKDAARGKKRARRVEDNTWKVEWGRLAPNWKSKEFAKPTGIERILFETLDTIK